MSLILTETYHMQSGSHHSWVGSCDNLLSATLSEEVSLKVGRDV